MINVECPSRRVLLTATGEGGDLIEDLDDVVTGRVTKVTAENRQSFIDEIISKLSIK